MNRLIKNAVFILWFILFSLSLTAQNQVISSEEAIKDFQQLTQELRTTHINPFNTFNSTTFVHYEDSALNYLSTLEEISHKDYTIFLMKYLALANDAHTSVSWGSLVTKADRKESIFFPLEIEWTENQQLVDVKTQKTITTVNGQNAKDLFDEAMLCQGGLYSFRQQITERMFFGVFLYLKNIQPPFKIAYNDSSSKIIEKGIDFYTLYDRLLPTKSNYTFEILDNNIGLISYNNCLDRKAFKRFLKQTFKEIQTKNIDKLIIDIRYNTGGNSDLNDDLLAYVTKKKYRQSSSKKWLVSETGKAFYTAYFPNKWLRNQAVRYYLKQPINHLIETDEFELVQPKKRKNYYDGKVCLLTGTMTFSSANFLADAVSTYDLMPIIGQPTGEYTNDFGEQIEYKLPNSKIKITLSTAFDVGANADADMFQIVQPDILVDENILDYAIEWILKN